MRFCHCMGSETTYLMFIRTRTIKYPLYNIYSVVSGLFSKNAHAIFIQYVIFDL